MKLFIAGIGGTFMGGLAQLAQAGGHQVSGCDHAVYPPMSTLLQAQDISMVDGYTAAHLAPRADRTRPFDQVIIGNVLSRGNPLVEAILDHDWSLCSGPQWLHEHVLRGRRVIAIAGTHGKTTTAALTNWILHQGIPHQADRTPGYLIGGQPGNFARSAQRGTSDWFVIEADEYDTAFFDKRAKFLHYRPYLAVLHNLEFDHADIYADLAQIQTQFHHFIRIVPPRGTLLVNADDDNLRAVLAMGHWSRIVQFSCHDRRCDWYAEAGRADCTEFTVMRAGVPVGEVCWNELGTHNMYNGLAAIAAAVVAGVAVDTACAALATFIATARRLQKLFQHGDCTLYEDFAHHPTAIAATLQAVKAHHPRTHCLAVLELSSNTMRSGTHGEALGRALDHADATILYQPQPLSWQPQSLATRAPLVPCTTRRAVREQVQLLLRPNSVIICCSNGSFDGVPAMLTDHLQQQVAG